MNARSFLTDELRRLNDTIAHLEVSLQRYTPADPRRAGNAALLAMQQREHTLLTELLACADDGDVLDCCHERLRRVEAEHLQLTLDGEAHDLTAARRWWATLDDLLMLADLLNRLNAAVAQVPYRPARPGGRLEAGRLEQHP